MPQSLVKNYVHIVYSTKYRQPFIYPPYELELHAIWPQCVQILVARPSK